MVISKEGAFPSTSVYQRAYLLLTVLDTPSFLFATAKGHKDQVLPVHPAANSIPNRAKTKADADAAKCLRVINLRSL